VFEAARKARWKARKVLIPPFCLLPSGRGLSVAFPPRRAVCCLSGGDCGQLATASCGTTLGFNPHQHQHTLTRSLRLPHRDPRLQRRS
jgi:hypothetical protein